MRHEKNPAVRFSSHERRAASLKRSEAAVTIQAKLNDQSAKSGRWTVLNGTVKKS
jgi:hypothetical protein